MRHQPLILRHCPLSSQQSEIYSSSKKTAVSIHSYSVKILSRVNIRKAAGLEKIPTCVLKRQLPLSCTPKAFSVLSKQIKITLHHIKNNIPASLQPVCKSTEPQQMPSPLPYIESSHILKITIPKSGYCL